MLYPSIDEMLDVVDSKFVLVNVCAKRARQIEESSDSLKEMEYFSKNSIGKALEEVNSGKLRIKR